MNNIIFNYLLKNFLKAFLVVALVIYSFGIILSLFEEINFFKNIDINFFIPLMLTSLLVPSLIIKLLPFIIFISSMWFMLKIRNNKDLLALKVYGYSNIKIFFILGVTSFVLGWLTLIFINPMTSSMAKYYEKTKSQYARDIDHLVTFNKNGLWIKENYKNNERIITAVKPDGFNLNNVTIFHFNEKYNLMEKIYALKADIKTNNWILTDVTIYKLDNGLYKKEKLNNYEIESIYNYEKITTLFNNADTMSFISLVFDKEKLMNNGYNKVFLNQSLQTMLTLPFFLFLMTSIASILTMHTLKKSDNIKFIILGLLLSVMIYYIKDFSLALGLTGKISLNLSIWAPIVALSLFTFIGVLQINEK
jgi:lipopolysaccharide export system permease protein